MTAAIRKMTAAIHPSFTFRAGSGASAATVVGSFKASSRSMRTSVAVVRRFLTFFQENVATVFERPAVLPREAGSNPVPAELRRPGSR
jgi:hypothetical protein